MGRNRGRYLFTLERLRSAAILLGLALIVGELWRSWGVGRPSIFVLEDIVAGSALILASLVMARDTTRRRAFFAAAWGMNAGMLYGSFFTKLFSPETTDAGNWDVGVLTAIIGIAFVISCIGTVATIMLSRE